MHVRSPPPRNDHNRLHAVFVGQYAGCPVGSLSRVGELNPDGPVTVDFSVVPGDAWRAVGPWSVWWLLGASCHSRRSAGAVACERFRLGMGHRSWKRPSRRAARRPPMGRRHRPRACRQRCRSKHPHPEGVGRLSCDDAWIGWTPNRFGDGRALTPRLKARVDKTPMSGLSLLTASFATRGSRVQIPSAPLRQPRGLLA